MAGRDGSDGSAGGCTPRQEGVRSPPDGSGRMFRPVSPRETGHPMYAYSVVRYDAPDSKWEPVNVGVILADYVTRTVHRRMLTGDETNARNAEPVSQSGRIAEMLRRGAGNGSGGIVGDSSTSTGDDMAWMSDAPTIHNGAAGADGDTIRMVLPRPLSMPPSCTHEEAIAWCFDSVVMRGKRPAPGEDVAEEEEATAECARAGRSGAAGTRNGASYTFSTVQYVPDVVRDEPVNIGVIVHDATRRRMGSRYASGGEIARLGAGRFDNPDVSFFCYERSSAVDDIGSYMDGIAEPVMSCLHCTGPHNIDFAGTDPVSKAVHAGFAASDRAGRGAGWGAVHAPAPADVIIEALYRRLVAPAPGHSACRHTAQAAPTGREQAVPISNLAP